MTDEEVYVAATVNDVEYVNLVGDDARRGFYTYIVHPGDCTASDYQHWKPYESLSKATLKNSYHVLYPYLPESQYQHYHLRQRQHNKALIPKTTYLSDRDYIMRMLYKNCY